MQQKPIRVLPLQHSTAYIVQQTLCESTAMLRHTHAAYLVYITVHYNTSPCTYTVWLPS